VRAGAVLASGGMHYEMFMAAALGEARSAAARGERPDGAVAVLDEAMVASGQEEVLARSDPTAHAIVITLREAADRLGRVSLSGITVFSAIEPCAMCVGAVLASDADGIVYGTPDPDAGAAGSRVQLTDGSLGRRLDVVSGILGAEAAELLRQAPAARETAARPSRPSVQPGA
jgi:tRNA(adenine34) deaminase